MYDLMKQYQIEGRISEEDTDEILQVLHFLTTFSMGYCEHLKSTHNNFDDALTIWVIRCEKWGWASKKVKMLVQIFTSEYRANKIFHKTGQPRKFPQHEPKNNEHKNWDRKIDNKEDIVYDGCLVQKVQDTAKAKIYDDKKDEIIKSLTKPQYACYDALYIKILSVEGTAKYLKKDVESIQRMVKVLDKLFDTQNLNENLQISDKEELTENEIIAEGNPTDDERNFESDIEEEVKDDD